MKNKWLCNSIIAAALVAGMIINVPVVKAEDLDQTSSATWDTDIKTGGGYSVTGQVKGAGYSTNLYDSSNGLPTSDANFVYADSKGYIWIGSYAGVIRYDGTNFERLDSSDGITSGKTIFEDSKGRLWIGTNDNGIVILDGEEKTRITYKEGLPSSTIRSFVEVEDGTIYVGTTSGVCYVDSNLKLHVIDDPKLKNSYVMRLVADNSGTVYGNNKNGDMFSIKDRALASFIPESNLGFGEVKAINVVPDRPGTVYIGNNLGRVYYGAYGKDVSAFKTIDVSPAIDVNWISYDCDRVWIIAESIVGYIDGNDNFVVLDGIPVNSGIEMLTEDYQGNIWIASTRQGVAKIVTNNFLNVTAKAGLEPQVVNSTCLYKDKLYVATDKGLFALDSNFAAVEDKITEYLVDTRIRCLMRDNEGNLWISTYNNNKGLICYKDDGDIISFNEEDGFISNGVRCTTLASDGSVLVGTNGGLAIIKNGEVIQKYTKEDGMSNTMALTVEEGPEGEILAGTDGGGIYSFKHGSISNLNRDSGLTSDVILRIKWDEERKVYWIITSNSIQYMQNGMIFEVKNFPYSNNFDIYFDKEGNAWILSSFGIYCVNADDMIEKKEYEYRLYDTASGLSGAVTGNSFSELDEEGNLYVSERVGVDKVNIEEFFQQTSEIRVELRNITCDDKVIEPDENGKYVLPADAIRIKINASILNYTLSDPMLRIYLEGASDEGLTLSQNNLSSLEYTGLGYGSYVLHIQIIDPGTETIYQDSIYQVEKQPKFTEIFVVRILMLALLALLGGFIVWRIMSGTIIRRQYKEIAAAKEEADRANSAKARFLANMSHEIRTPINTIMGMDEMILRENTEGVPKPYATSMVKYAKDIRSASESLLGLINNLLDISKIESGKMNLVEKEYSPAKLICEMAKMISVRSDAKDLNFELDIDEEIPRKLYGDEGKVKQVVLNLLTNAVKYTKEGGLTLKVSVLEKDGSNCQLMFSVKDTGIGVKPEDMEKIFSAFERMDEKKSDDDMGVGLGLDISYQFVKLMNGKLTCESVYGEGATFIFTLKQKIVEATPIGQFSLEEEETVDEGPYVPQFVAPDAAILVVDDNPMNLTVIKGLLDATKMFVSTAASGEECLEKLKEGTFDVVLLDQIMPEMDGVETLEKIREKHPDLPVYALTTNMEADGEQFYISKGFTGYLSKPIDPRLLESTIKKHLPEDIMSEA